MKYRIMHLKNENVFEVSFSNKSQTYSRIDEISNLKREDSLALCNLVGSFFDFMPGHIRGRSLHQLPAWIWKRSDCFPSEVTFYGGSFYPWHEGHDACLKLFPKPESLLVLPDNSPWKTETRNLCHWTFFKELALKYRDTNVSFYPGFLGMEEKNPTVNWLPFAIVKDKSLLVGDDTFHGLSRWYNVELLLKSIRRIYIVPRIMDAINYEDGFEFIHREAPQIELVRLPHHSFEHISSTAIRKSWV